MGEFKLTGKVSMEEFFDSLKDLEIVTKKENKMNIEYYNVPCSFDIETSTFTYNLVLSACMYIWQFGINGKVVTGRTWEEYEEFVERLKDELHLSVERRLPVYVRNLSFEFQWIKDRFRWHDIFAREKNSPFKATTVDGIEYRCSYVLAGCSLETTGKNLVKYKVEKMVGDLDYNKLRSSRTPITIKEMGYCIHDCLVDMAYIKEEMEQWGDVTKIPMTATGKVRIFCRNHCFNSQYEQSYRGKMKELRISGVKEYNLLKDAFTAGFTHANWQAAGEIWVNVYSKDFTSSYPTVMISEKLPMSKGEWVEATNIKQIENMAKAGYYLIFEISLDNVKEIPGVPDHYISISKCKDPKKIKCDNGRVVTADHLKTTITSDDWDIIKKVYTFDEPEIGECIRYYTDYLPKPLLECVIHFYKKKTTLKDVLGSEIEYQMMKGNLNSTFGMCVTDIVNDDIEYVDEWITNNTNPEEAIKEYNNSKNRFLFYPWGIAICSKARKNLWSGILELGQDYLYSDTDSVKYINEENHREYFESYNKEITEKLRKCCEIRGLNFEDTRPKTVKGKEKPLGVWDDDGTYNRFKTLGAKRYLVEYIPSKEEVEKLKGNMKKYYEKTGFVLKSTIAGLSKKDGIEYICSKKDPFEFFDDRMTIDEDHSGRLIHTYINEPFEYEMTDYLGNYYQGKELSAVALTKSEYNLKISPLYMALLNGQEKIIFN